MTLDELAIIGKTDKSSKHLNYTRYYEEEFEARREDTLHVLELGTAKGASLYMWKEYFKNSLIVGVDVVNDISEEFKGLFDSKCKLEIGDQTDPIFLTNLVKSCGGFDIIIDDASHLASKTIKSFEILFPLLNSKGIYVIEDLGVFYPHSEKGSYFKDLGEGATTVDFLKNLVDIKSDEWFLEYNSKPTSELYSQIKKLTFYSCMCFIHKN